jgi:pimeloyl-ACP methyl ester carboxylesterase
VTGISDEHPASRYGPGVLSAYLGGIAFGEAYGPEPARVLALHGWGRTHDDFRESMSGSAAASAPLAAIALDLPGFGASPPPPEAWGAAEYATALEPLLEEMAGGSRSSSAAAPLVASGVWC